MAQQDSSGLPDPKTDDPFPGRNQRGRVDNIFFITMDHRLPGSHTKEQAAAVTAAATNTKEQAAEETAAATNTKEQAAKAK